MSHFILYFEKKSQIKNRNKYRKNDDFPVDKEIMDGHIAIQYEGMIFDAAIMAFRMDAALFYVFKKPTKWVGLANRIRGKLFDFIESRIESGFEPYLFVLDLHGAWPEQMVIRDAPQSVIFSQINHFFEKGVQTGLFKIVP